MYPPPGGFALALGASIRPPPRLIHLKQFRRFGRGPAPVAIRPTTDIRLQRNIGRDGPILLQKSVVQVVCGVPGFLGRAGTVVLRQAAAELPD